MDLGRVQDLLQREVGDRDGVALMRCNVVDPVLHSESVPVLGIG